MRVLITRPAADLTATAAALGSAGHAVTAHALLSVERLPDATLNLVGAQAFIVSDSEGARALADAVGVRTFPVFADGAAAAEAARRAEADERERRRQVAAAKAAEEKAERERLEAERRQVKEAERRAREQADAEARAARAREKEEAKARVAEEKRVQRETAAVADAEARRVGDLARAERSQRRRAAFDAALKRLSAWRTPAQPAVGSPQSAPGATSSVPAPSPDVAAPRADRRPRFWTSMFQPRSKEALAPSQLISAEPTDHTHRVANSTPTSEPAPGAAPIPFSPEVSVMAPTDESPPEKAPEKQTAAEREPPRAAIRATPRAARLHAEDAADQRLLTQRRFGLGRGDEPPPAGDTEQQVANAAPEPAPAGRSWRGALFLVVVLVVAGAIVASAPVWTPRAREVVRSLATALFGPSQPTALETQIAALERSVESLSARLAAAEQKPQPPSVGPAVVAALETRVAALETKAAAAESTPSPVTAVDNEALIGQAQLLTSLTARVATLEAAIGNVARLEQLSGQVDSLAKSSAEAASVLALSDRVAALESAGRDAATVRADAAAFVLAATQLRAAVDGERPFAGELASLRMMASRLQTALDTEAFAGFAETGLPALGRLRVGFNAVAAAVVRADAAPETSKGWMARTLDRLMSIATIRPVGDIAGASAAAIVARAEARIGDGDLAAATAELSALTGAAQAAAEPWLTQAKTRVAADRALTDALAKGIAGLSPAGAP